MHQATIANWQLPTDAGDGFVTPEELRPLLANLGERVSDADLAEIVLAGDKNGDGKLDYLVSVAHLVSTTVPCSCFRFRFSCMSLCSMPLPASHLSSPSCSSHPILSHPLAFFYPYEYVRCAASLV